MAVHAETNIIGTGLPDIVAPEAGRGASLLRESTGWLGKLGTGLALSGMAVAAKWADAAGLAKDLPSPADWIVTSCAHPVLGFTAACVANAQHTKRWFERHSRWGSAYLSLRLATIVNFASEEFQRLTTHIGEYNNFLAPHNLPETAKDYLFALGGAALYSLLDRPKGTIE